MQYAKLDYLALIEISGVDALNFLQGQLTADISLINEHTSSLTAHCNLKGRMVSLGRIFKKQNSYCYIVSSEIQEKAIKRLQKYAMFSKVSLSLNNDLHIFGLANTATNPESWPEKPDAVLEKNDQTLIKMPGEPNRVLCISKVLPKIEAEEMPEAWWQMLEIQNKIPFLTKETVATYLPHDINLPKLGGVSFQKGCFVGQEIVARMEYLGKLKKSIQISTNPSDAGTEVCSTEYNNEMFRLILTS